SAAGRNDLRFFCFLGGEEKRDGNTPTRSGQAPVTEVGTQRAQRRARNREEKGARLRRRPLQKREEPKKGLRPEGLSYRGKPRRKPRRKSRGKPRRKDTRKTIGKPRRMPRECRVEGAGGSEGERRGGDAVCNGADGRAGVRRAGELRRARA